jgi:hypothetical protein
MCCVLLLLAVCGTTTSARTVPRYDVAAYVWPAYFNEPRFKDIGVFPDGHGEWESVYNAVPKFKGHRQPRVPLWGYLDESSPKTQEKIINAATSHGVNTFIFDWYWYDDKPFLEQVLDDGFLKAKNNGKMRFYLMWANHNHMSYLDYKAADKSKMYWSGAVSRQTFDHFTEHVIKDYFKRPNYYKIDGKPVFAIYEISTFIGGLGGMEQAKAALRDFNARCVKAGLPGVHFQAILWSAIPSTLSAVPGDKSSTQDNTLTQLGFSSVTNYQWCHYVPANQDYESWGEAATAKYASFDSTFTAPYFPHVSIDWDNNPRFPGGAQPAVSGVTPAKFKKFLYKAKAYIDAHPQQVPLVTINAWNEWAEGSYLEPDTVYKYEFLDAVKEVFGK